MMEGSVGMNYRLTAGRPTQVSVLTAPHAVCKITVISGTTTDGHDAHLATYADGNGQVSFTIESTRPTSDPVVISIRWESVRDSGNRTLEIRFVTDERTPRLISEVPDLAPWGAVEFPPFSEADAMVATPAEIRSRRLPPRPDVKHAPTLFETWMEIATRGMVWVPPVPLSGRRRPFRVIPRRSSDDIGRKSLNWSGAELRGPAGEFQGAYGYWKVPPVTGEASQREQQWMYEWVGLDGDGTTDLVQAGTGGRVEITPTAGGPVRAACYFAWTQLLPLQQTGQCLSNFGINAGDSVFVRVDAARDPQTRVLTGTFTFLNRTSGVGTSLQTQENFTGDAPLNGAEWIVERPGLPPNYTFLANFGTTDMEDCAAIVNGVPVGHKGSDDPSMGLISYNLSMVDAQGKTLADADTETSVIELNWLAKG